jgi:hypothetical protein
MNNEDFFQNILLHLENRVEMVDNRSNIFLAVAIGLLVALGYVVKEFFYNVYGYAFLGAHIVFSLIVCLLFLQVIRPSRYVFFGSADPKYRLGSDKYIFWPEKAQRSRRNNPSEFKKFIESFNDKDILENYKEVVHVELQIVEAKYKFYVWAVNLFKVLALFDMISAILLATQLVLN